MQIVAQCEDLAFFSLLMVVYIEQWHRGQNQLLGPTWPVRTKTVWSFSQNSSQKWKRRRTCQLLFLWLCRKTGHSQIWCGMSWFPMTCVWKLGVMSHENGYCIVMSWVGQFLPTQLEVAIPTARSRSEWARQNFGNVGWRGTATWKAPADPNGSRPHRRQKIVHWEWWWRCSKVWCKMTLCRSG